MDIHWVFGYSKMLPVCQVLIDGQDVKTLDLSSFRRFLGIVPQAAGRAGTRWAPFHGSYSPLVTGSYLFWGVTPRVAMIEHRNLIAGLVWWEWYPASKQLPVNRTVLCLMTQLASASVIHTRDESLWNWPLKLPCVDPCRRTSWLSFQGFNIRYARPDATDAEARVSVVRFFTTAPP